MKRFYTLLLGAAIPLLGLSQTASLPYQSLLYEDADWTTESLASDTGWEDDKTSDHFTNSTASQKVGKKYKWDPNSAADDWLISPAFHLEANKEYKVKYYHQSGNYLERCAVWYGTAATAAELKSRGTNLGIKEGKKVEEYVTYTFSPAADGDYHFALQACSEKDLYFLYVSDFQLRENVFAPGAPTDVTVTPGADRALEATVAWVWPTTDVDGSPLAADATYDKVVITRDGVEVKTITDKSVTSWVDNAATGLTAGKHVYGLTCYVNGAPSAEAMVTSKHIGPVGALALPYKLSETTKEDFDLFWTFVKGEGSGSDNVPEYWVSSSMTSRNISYTTGRKAVDEWFIGPALKFHEAGVYRVKVDYAFNQENKTFDMYLGTGSSPAGYTEKVASFTGTSRTTDYKILSIAAPCEKALAFHFKTETDAEAYTIYVYDYEVEKWHVSPMPVTGLNAEVTGTDKDKVTLSWTNPDKNNANGAITALSKVEIYRGEELVTTLTENIVPSQTSTYEDTPGTAGVFTYKVVTYLGDVACDEPAVVTTGWVGDETRTLPFSTYFSSSDVTVSMWKTVDADPDNGLAWSTPADGTYPKLPAPESGFGKYNDYLVSPLIDFTEAGTYQIYTSIKGGSSSPGMQLEVGLVSDKSSDAAIISSYVSTGEHFVSDSERYSNYTEIYINVATPGKYAVALFTPALNTDGQPNRLTASNKDLEVGSFGVKRHKLYPAAATDLSVTADPTGAMKATLAWTNPSAFTTTNIDATPVLTKVVIERKAQTAAEWIEVHTITEGLEAGAQMSWLDETLPAAGVYSYRITVYGTDGTAADDKGVATVESGWVGAAAKLEIDTENDEQGFHKDEWKIVSYKETGNWEFNYFGTSVNVTSRSTKTDEWLISPYYGFEAGKDYYFDVTSYTEDPGTMLQVYHGTAQKAAACKTKICDLTMNGSVSKDSWQHDKFIVRAVAADAPATAAETVGDIPVYTVPVGTGVFAFRLEYSIGSIYQGGSVTLRNLFVTEYVPAATVTVTGAEGKTDVTLGSTLALTATVAPDNTTVKDVVWSSENTDIATVDAEGVVTGKAVGQVKITATCGTAVGELTVTVNPILADAVTLDITEKEVLVGEEFTLTATVAPENTTDKTIEWISDNTDVATVSPEGKVTAHSVGTATITAACGEATATCAVTVNPVLANAVTLDITEKEVFVGEEFTLTATVAPENTTDKTVTWTTDNAAVAIVSTEGKVTAVGVGTATITATCGEATATCAVTANPVLAESITLDKTVINAVEGTTVQLTATVLPANTTDPMVTWTSSDPTVATVDHTGLVSVLKAGECKIIATCGNVSAECEVTGVSGIAGIIADDPASVEVYTLGGVRISDTLNLRPGFYIARYLKDGAIVTEKIRIK